MNISDVKQELSSDEKVLESAFKLETLYKKYKRMIWGIATGLILLAGGNTIMGALEKSRLETANQAFLTLQKNPEDASALSVLKEKNPALFELYTFAKATKDQDAQALASLTNSKNDVVADASRYTAAVLENKSVDSKLFADLVLLEEAYLAIQNGDMKKAQDTLSMIDQRSSVASLALLLKHSTIKGKGNQ